MTNPDLSLQMAPLQGFTELPVRHLFHTCFGGIDTYFSPFVRLERGEFRARDMRDIAPEKNRVTLVPQLIGGDAVTVRTILSRFHSLGYRRADINMGCPFPMIVRRGWGSGILPYPDRVQEVLHVLSEFPDISCSVKIRLGYEDPEECLHLAAILNEAPLSQITLHPRLGVQQYSGTCDWDAFARFASLCHHPLVYNGDIRSVADIERVKARFPSLHAVMIGRGLLDKPWLAAVYREKSPWDLSKKMASIYKFHAELFSYYTATLQGGDAQVLQKMKAFWEYFLVSQDPKWRKKIKKATRLSQYEQAANSLIQHLQDV